MNDKPAPAPLSMDERKPPAEFKVADISDGTVFLKMEDGRHFAATVKEGVEVKRRDRVVIKSDEIDKEGVPVGAEVVKVLS